MSKAGVHTTDRESPDEWFERELAELKADLARLEASLAPTPSALEEPQTSATASEKQPSEKPAPAQTSSHPAPTTSAPTPPAPPPPADPVAPPAPPPTPAPALPTGTDLADPKNFGMMPPTADLDEAIASPEEYRQRLARHLAFATKVLHTSRVPAAVWREWRVFEKAVHERLRSLAGGPR